MAWVRWLRLLGIWALGALGVLAFAAFAAALAYWSLLALGLSPSEAAAVALPLGPAFVVAVFTVALWRSTQVQSEVARAMGELQRRVLSAELSPLLGVRVIREYGAESTDGGQWLEVSNLGKYGVLLTGVYLLNSCSSDLVDFSSVTLLGLRSDFPVALPAGQTKKILMRIKLQGDKQSRSDEEVELGCLVLALLYGSEPHLLCLRMRQVVDLTIRVVYDSESVQESSMEQETTSEPQLIRKVNIPAKVLENFECPQVLEKLRRSLPFS